MTLPSPCPRIASLSQSVSMFRMGNSFFDSDSDPDSDSERALTECKISRAGAVRC